MEDHTKAKIISFIIVTIIICLFIFLVSVSYKTTLMKIDYCEELGFDDYSPTTNHCFNRIEEHYKDGTKSNIIRYSQGEVSDIDVKKYMEGIG